ncbi:MAG: fimbrillin family protein, partial [Tidjanibacter sp.]|nr:fimbrillin family protein [Tidjanibacter sp.]
MKRLLTCVALLGLLVGCKEPLPEEPIIPEGKLPINLSLSTTRANDSAYEAGDQIGLYVANYADGVATQLANSGNHVNNLQFTLTDGDWTPATKIYWKDKSTRADFYAYYPYQSTVADVTALPVSVQADQSTEDNYWASDLLWGKTSGVAPTESAVNIATSHTLSNLLIYVEPGYGFTAESLAAANVSVEINNVKTAGTLNLSNGEVTASGEATITPWNTGEYYRALIVPQTVADDTTLITVTVDGKAHTIERSFTFVANTQHKFVVRIEKDFETKVTLSINPWNQDPNTYGIPDNEIWYTATEKVTPYASNVFGANIVSNEWDSSSGKGVITFDGDVTSIGNWAFQRCSSLTSITLPEGVTSIGGYA